MIYLPVGNFLDKPEILKYATFQAWNAEKWQEVHRPTDEKYKND
jgi:hypothetical protein